MLKYSGPGLKILFTCFLRETWSLMVFCNKVLKKIFGCVCVCVCVCLREREREGGAVT